METELSGAVAYVETEPSEEPETYVEKGEITWPENEDETVGEPETCIETGEIAWPEDEPSEEPAESELMGDVAYFPEESGNG